MEDMTLAMCRIVKSLCDEHGLNVVDECQKHLGVVIKLCSDGEVQLMKSFSDYNIVDTVGRSKTISSESAEAKENVAVKIAELREDTYEEAEDTKEAKKAAVAAKKAAAKEAREAKKAAVAAKKAAAKEAREAKKAAAKEAREAKKAANKGRVCGKCGLPGHNKRTCKHTMAIPSGTLNLLDEFDTSSPSDQVDAPETLTAPVEALETLAAPVEAPETLAAPVEAPETLAAPVDAPETLTAPVEAPETLAAPVEAPETLAAPVEAPETLAAPVEAPETLAAPVEAPETLAAPVEAPETLAAPVETDGSVLTTEQWSDEEEDIRFTHKGVVYIKRKFDGRQAVWNDESGSHIGDWVGEWESDTGTIDFVDNE
jgi:hypothetical protein